MSNKAFRTHIKTDRANTKGRKPGAASTSCGIPSTNDHTEQERVIERLKEKHDARK